MANLVRNDLAIEGANIEVVLDAIGFNPNGKDPSGVPLFGAGSQAEDLALLIDFNRIVPSPNDPPDEGWTKWASDNWGTVPYDGASDGDIFELTENKARFKFYSKWSSPVPLLETLAKRFPEFKFHLWNWDQTNHRFGEVAWQNGTCTLFVPVFQMKMRDDADEPAMDPITDEMKATAAQLVRAAAGTCNGYTPNTQAAESMVASVIAASGRSVKVNFQKNDDGWCLCVEA